MIISDYIQTIAGSFILISLVLGYFIHEYFYFFTFFVGLNLFQSGISGFCPLAKILKRMGL
ncbi:MAG: DUF2892 domain-containing protein [Desulfobacterales bacterium]|nr:DUF2892 domain-containing protein [Desulfobacterales bacterium]